MRKITMWARLLWFLILSVNLSAGQNAKLLILSPEGPQFDQAIEGIRNELVDEFQIKLIPVAEIRTSYHQFDREMRRNPPDLVVLLDNRAIQIYRAYRATHGDKQTFPPAIASMAVLLEESIKGLPNTIGISYDVPAVTSLTNLRDLIGVPLQRIGVIHRTEFQDFVDRQKALCLEERLELVTYPLDKVDRSISRDLNKGLRHLIRKENIDALWILNDNTLLNQSLVEDVWLTRLWRFKKPVVVGVPNIYHEKLGNFAVYPDNYGIGIQVADLALDVKANQWRIPPSSQDNPVKDPVSIKKHLRLGFAKKHFQLKEDKLGEIDIIDE